MNFSKKHPILYNTEEKTKKKEEKGERSEDREERKGKNRGIEDRERITDWRMRKGGRGRKGKRGKKGLGKWKVFATTPEGP